LEGGGFALGRGWSSEGRTGSQENGGDGVLHSERIELNLCFESCD
jgi:hypothetical protein